MGTQQSSWIVQVHAALQKVDATHNPSQLLIWKVPAEYRTDAALYEPVNSRFGLHHCPEILHTNGTEGFKIELARALQFTEQGWNSFCERVVSEPKEYWEAVYDQSPHTGSYSVEEIRCLLALDALLLVVFLQGRGGGTESLGPTLQKVMENPLFEVQIEALWTDLWLVENQIPMELLKRVVGILTTEYKLNIGNMWRWEDAERWQGWNIGNFVAWEHFHDPSSDGTNLRELFERRMEKWLKHVDSYDDVHILDSTYRILCGWENLDTPHLNPCPNRYSATDLEACGVKIKGKEFTCLEDISFENGCLSVPFLQVYDETEKYLRNLLVYEVLTRPRGRRQYSVDTYAFFMEGLMRTPEDVNLLVKRGVMSLKISSQDVVDMWKRVNKLIPEPLVTDEFSTMLKNVGKYAKLRRNKYRFEFKKQFCSRPWIPLSYLAASIVTAATLLQTYVAVIGSNGMKPHFPHQ